MIEWIDWTKTNFYTRKTFKINFYSSWIVIYLIEFLNLKKCQTFLRLHLKKLKKFAFRIVQLIVEYVVPVGDIHICLLYRWLYKFGHRLRYKNMNRWPLVLVPHFQPQIVHVLHVFVHRMFRNCYQMKLKRIKFH